MKVTSRIYKDYPEQPYISPDRDLAAWEESPEDFHYGIIAKDQMRRLEEGVLPGHIIMLWRIGFNNFTTISDIPQYFEYRYGVDSHEAIATLRKLGYIRDCSATESLDILNVTQLKKILKKKSLPVSGKRDDVVGRVLEHFSEAELADAFAVRKYAITDSGKALLAKYDNVIQKHGPKM